MEMNANEKVLYVIETSKDRLRKAESAHRTAYNEVTALSRSSIDLFGGDAVGRVAEIATKMERANDIKYAECQSLILMIDQQCRPLIKENLLPSTVKSVVDMIKKLNDSSRIDVTYNASLNGYGMGNVAAKSYMPSVECNMIQSFWETTYDMMPEVVEEKRKKEAKKIADAHEREETIQKRYEAAKEKYNAEKELYDKAYAEWKKKAEEIESQIKKRIEAERASLLNEIESKRDKVVAKTQKTIEEQSRRKEKAKTMLASLGFFKFAERKEQKAIIDYVERAIKEAVQQRNNAEKEYASDMESFEKTLEQRSDSIRTRIENDNPVTKEPKAPVKPIEPVMPPKNLTPSQMEKEAVKEDILNYMACCYDHLVSVDELVEMVPACREMTNQRVGALVRQLVNEYAVERINEEGQIYFRILL